MLTDKTILIKSIEKYANSIASKFLGFSGIGSEMIINIAVNNLVNKYGNVIDIFIDKDGNIPNVNDLFDAFRNVLDDKGGITIGNIKFTKDDISTIEKIFKDLKSKQ
ncbi:MAG: hypothetical protein RSE41_03080 [Clostridia bacterium]